MRILTQEASYGCNERHLVKSVRIIGIYRTIYPEFSVIKNIKSDTNGKWGVFFAPLH